MTMYLERQRKRSRYFQLQFIHFAISSNLKTILLVGFRREIYGASSAIHLKNVIISV